MSNIFLNQTCILTTFNDVFDISVRFIKSNRFYTFPKKSSLHRHLPQKCLAAVSIYFISGYPCTPSYYSHELPLTFLIAAHEQFKLNKPANIAMKFIVSAVDMLLRSFQLFCKFAPSVPNSWLPFILISWFTVFDVPLNGVSGVPEFSCLNPEDLESSPSFFLFGQGYP